MVTVDSRIAEIRRERLGLWLDDVQLSQRLGSPHYANPGELKDDLRALLAALVAVEAELRQARELLAEWRDLGAAGGGFESGEANEPWRATPATPAIFTAGGLLCPPSGGSLASPPGEPT